MDRSAVSRIWAMRLAYVGLALLVMFFLLLPLDMRPGSWAPPDLLLALTLAWSVRRPDYVPALLIAAVMLLADLMFHRPPGLMALLVLVASEQLKRRARDLRDATFPAEWIAVGGAIVLITLTGRLVLALLSVQQAPLSLSLIEMVMTLVFYPLVVAGSYLVLGIRKATPGDVDRLGAGI